jgi:hypothetical protein
VSARVTHRGCLTVRLHPHRLWRAAAREATQALRAWQIAPARERGRAYFDYCVALEREERAAAVLEAGSSS